jgi:pimeloyl-[acyl-carrier protein] methyl ester esterase
MCVSLLLLSLLLALSWRSCGVTPNASAVNLELTCILAVPDLRMTIPPRSGAVIIVAVRLVLLPGMDGTGVLFRWFVRLLPRNSEPIIVRYPRDRFLKYEDLAAEVSSALPSEAYSILAESYSGPLAVLLAARNVGEPRALVFINSFVCQPAGRAGAMLATCFPGFVFRYPALLSVLRRTLTNACTNPEIVTAFGNAVSQVDPAVLAERFRAALTIDVSNELINCRIRTIYLRSTKDRFIGNRGLRSVLNAKPETEVAKIAGPHLALQCSPMQSISALQELGIV